LSRRCLLRALELYPNSPAAAAGLSITICAARGFHFSRSTGPRACFSPPRRAARPLRRRRAHGHRRLYRKKGLYWQELDYLVEHEALVKNRQRVFDAYLFLGDSFIDKRMFRSLRAC
jgi:hypothetical protein